MLDTIWNDTGILLETVNPRALGQQDIKRVCEIERDMWARNEGLGEYMMCEQCSKIYSKQDIYPNLPKNQYRFTVSELERANFLDTNQRCDCGGNLDYIFPEGQYIEHICERYSWKALLVLMKKDEEIVWFMDGYIADFSTIYDRELIDHYEEVWEEQIAQLVRWKLNGILPDEMFSCSSLWTRESYMNYYNIYYLLQCFFLNFPEKYEWHVGISELDSGGTLYKMYRSLWSESIGMSWFQNDSNISDIYNSDVFIQKNLWRTYKKAFACDPKTFLRRNKVSKK